MRLSTALTAPPCHRRCPLRRLLLLCTMLCAMLAAPPAPASADDVGRYLGFYHPNTAIELRGDQLWMVRPPYQTQLVPIGDGHYGVVSGWLAGTPLHFTPNPDGSTSILLLNGAGQWGEFARSGRAYPQIDPALDAAFGQILNQTVANPQNPGVVMSVVVPGQGLWAGARGVSNIAAGIPMVPGNQMRIASVTKLFVATVALQLVQEGWLALDQTVERWLPGLVPGGDRINVQQLLSHTSGLGEYMDENFMRAVIAEPGRFWMPQELVRYGVSKAAYFGPGEPGRWRYSNTNYVLLGLIIEQATRSTLHQEVHHRIIGPLGLSQTFFEPFDTPPGVASGYEGRRDLTGVTMSFAWGAGNITATAEDLARFAQGLFGGQLLRPEALALMRGFIGVNGAWGTRHLVYGLGLMQDVLGVAPRPDGQPRDAIFGTVEGHSGALIGYRTVVWYLPESGATVAVSINRMSADPNIVVTKVIDVLLAYRGV